MEKESKRRKPMHLLDSEKKEDEVVFENRRPQP
jgi:hypothetical protein